MRRNGARWAATGAEVLLLTAVVAFLSSIVVRSHWGSIWLEAFTGWVAPIANRMAGGTVLYGPGGHLPIPPLPFLLTYAVSGGHATWLTESVLIVVCQSVLILTMYVGLAGHLPRPIPLLAALLTAPVYFAFPKTILYDSLTHALVALTAVAAAWQVHRRGTGAGGRVGAGALVGTLAAVTVFSKQSIGIGLVLGVLALLAVGPPSRPLSRRVAQVVGFGVAALLGFGALALASYQYIDFKGMIVDVFLTGTQPKGGSAFITRGVRSVIQKIGAETIQTLVYGVGLTALFARRDAGGAADSEAPEAPAIPAPFHPAAVLAAYVVACGTPLLLGVFDVPPAPGLAWEGPMLKALRESILWAGLIFLLLTFLDRVVRPGSPAACSPRSWLAALFPTCLLAATFQSLSVGGFTGLADNNRVQPVWLHLSRTRKPLK